jgi:transposase-like protein
MNCPKCKSENYLKAGFVQTRQRYRCKECNYLYSVVKKSTARTNDIKRLAIELYLEGIGINSLARLFQVSHVTVQQWMRKHEHLVLLKSEKPISIIELKDFYPLLLEKQNSTNTGFLIIELGQDMTNSYWVLGEQKKVRMFGKKNRIK